jgi:Uma2 family endonuclease
MNVALGQPWTLDRFLAWEDRQEGRHEFDGAGVIEVTGGSRNHQRIVTNLVRLLDDALDPARFEALPEMRIEAAGNVRYPDVAVVAAPVPGSLRTLRDAFALFEVVSEDSQATDRGAKRAEYASLASLARYIILEQTKAAATILVRTESGWTESQAGEHLPLPELGVMLPLAGIYRGVRFE